MKHFYYKARKLATFPIYLFAVLLTMASCKNSQTNNIEDNEFVVTVDANGKASGSHRFTKIDNMSFYIDDIKYTAHNGDLEVSGYDEGFFKGEAKLIAQLNYDGRKMKVIAINNDAFRSCQVLTSIIIPSGVTSIGDNAFHGCVKLASLSIPNSVKTIGDYAFYACPKLISITIPNGVVSIGESAFGACIGLKYLTIPNSVESIGGAAFYACVNLTLVKVKRKTPVTIDFITFINQKNATLSVPFGGKEAYEAAAYWQDFKEIIEEAQ